jgi:hypothetical protein
MSLEAKGWLALFGGAVALGVVADVLFDGRPLGLNVAVFALAFVAALALLLHASRAPWHQGRRFMAAPLLAFAAMFAWHDSPLLTFANSLGLVGAVSLGALRRSQPWPADATLAEYGAGLVSAGAGVFAGTIDLLEREVRWDEMTRGLRGARAAALGRGLILGLPFLLVFGSLFVAADAVFRRLLESALPTSLPSLWPHVLVACGAAWAAAGLLRDLAAHREDARLVPGDVLVARKPNVSIGATEIAVALAALDVLFAAFVAVQARFLFGGRSVVLAHDHLTYAQYARHGFFELVAVSILVVPVVLAAKAAAREHRRLVAALSAVLVVLELAVAASALQRMHVYVDQYGLTELRIYATGVILWIAIVLVWALATVVRGAARRFAVGAIVAGFAATLALNVIDPDALVARTNLDSRHVDAAYLARLSDDAVPTLVARLATVRAPDARRALANALLERRFDEDPLGWNASRSAARAAIEAHRAEIALFAAG